MKAGGSSLPRKVQNQLDRIAGDRVIVASARTISIDDLQRFAHLGLAVRDGHVTVGELVPPPRTCGKQAQRNLDGWKEKRTDLPKETRTISQWAPSWNSGSFHLVSRTIDAYPVDYHPARILTISATALEHLVAAALVRFRVDQPLNKNTEGFSADLKFNIQLLREAVGDASIYDADLSDEDFAVIQHVDWELLPPGSTDKVLKRLTAQRGTPPERLKVATERLQVLERLGHDGYIVGKGRFAQYFGAVFGDRLVALENLEYGNALYVFEESWEAMSQLSRSELIRRRDPGVHRIPHVAGWGSAIRKILKRW